MSISILDLARQSIQFSRPPNVLVVEEIEKLTEKPVARTRKELLTGDMLGERDQATTAALERATRKIGILALLPASQRMDLCRRLNLIKIREEHTPLFRQGDLCTDFYIPVLGAFRCDSEMHRECLNPETESFEPPVMVSRVVGAGKDLYFEQGVGMPPPPGMPPKDNDRAFAKCIATAWPRLNEPKEEKKQKLGGEKKKMSISERRASKRSGGLCKIIAIPMQDLIETLRIPANEIQLRAYSMRSLSLFKTWPAEELSALSYHFEHLVVDPKEEFHPVGGKFYLVIKGTVDVFWMKNRPQRPQSGQNRQDQPPLRVQMSCDDSTPCFGEHLLCSDFCDFLGFTPHLSINISKYNRHGATNNVELLIATPTDIWPYFNKQTKQRFEQIAEERRGKWFSYGSRCVTPLLAHSNNIQTFNSGLHPVSTGRKLPTSADSISMESSFVRFAPLGMETSHKRSPSRLKYNEDNLSHVLQKDSDVDTTQSHKSSIMPLHESQRFIRTLPSTRRLTRPGSVDNEAENWCMSISSPFEGTKTFSG